MKRVQMSESVIVYFLLSLSGGCMDAYSYLCRDKVFANAQTGNMVLLGISIVERDHAGALKYFFPVFAFAVGIMLSDLIQTRAKTSRFHWRQQALVVEILILSLVAGFPQERNELANALISFACGIQVETFRSLRGNSIATTMCIGNLRSGVSNFDLFLSTRDKKYLQRSLVYLGIIVTFVAGAMIESILLKAFAERALYFSVVMLTAAFLFMLRAPREHSPAQDR